jgi:hypothetical protein
MHHAAFDGLPGAAQEDNQVAGGVGLPVGTF